MVKRDIEISKPKPFSWSANYSDGEHLVINPRHPYCGSIVELRGGRVIRVTSLEQTCSQCNPSGAQHGGIW